jgi:hypothetical protein
LLGRQKTAQGKERVQAIYLLKLGIVKTIGELAQWLGRHRVTVQEWLAAYRGWRARKFTDSQTATRTTSHNSRMGSGSTAKTRLLTQKDFLAMGQCSNGCLRH